MIVKKIKNLEVKFNNDINIIVGDNETRKSIIIQAIDFVLKGSRIEIEFIFLKNSCFP